MKGEKYVLIVRNQQGKVVHRSEHPFTKLGRIVLKTTMRTVLFEAEEKLLAKGHRVAGRYYDCQWYGCNSNKHISIVTRKNLRLKPDRFDEALVRRRRELFERSEDDAYEQLAERTAYQNRRQLRIE